jgi:hypothetical protein
MTHDQHQKAGIKYQATCEECQKEQLGKFSNGTIHATHNTLWVNGRLEKGAPVSGYLSRRQPKYPRCP